MPTVQKFLDIDSTLISEAKKRLISDGACDDDVSIREVITTSVENWLPMVTALADISGYGRRSSQETKRRPRSFDVETWQKAEFASRELVDVATVALLRGALRLQADHGMSHETFQKTVGKELRNLEGEMADQISTLKVKTPGKKRSTPKKTK